MRTYEMTDLAYAVAAQAAPVWTALAALGVEASEGARRARPAPDAAAPDAAAPTPRAEEGRPPPEGEPDVPAAAGRAPAPPKAPRPAERFAKAEPGDDPLAAPFEAGASAPRPERSFDLSSEGAEGHFDSPPAPLAPESGDAPATLDLQQRQLAALLNIERNTARPSAAVAE